MSHVYNSFGDLGEICHEGAFLELPNTDLPMWNVLGQDHLYLDDDQVEDDTYVTLDNNDVNPDGSWAGSPYEEFLVDIQSARHALEAKLASERAMWEHIEMEMRREEGEQEREEKTEDVDVTDQSFLAYYYDTGSSLALDIDADVSLLVDYDLKGEMESEGMLEAEDEDESEEVAGPVMSGWSGAAEEEVEGVWDGAGSDWSA
ncbi:hypothetical protein NEOLEDRAFT_1175710 [Neolentinus lepideus HHB14362 ss-1]|uniref:Uncharacterized protein n=1 Tax=Neolentinus lepideus HHB14362 ss-1 TaxID=1314782 RepID=A0A165UYS2_9AGAM|nr:hypothetical protein NEOLEDRAFT_1175710 [Neolentinus lepideus HHB14362 ss-1]